jgi:ERCC4-related helicase
MSGFQMELNFGDEITPQVLNEEEQEALMGDLLRKHKISGLDLSKFKFRPRQFALLSALLEDRNTRELFEEDTGGGKTGIFLVEALQVLAQGGRAIFITVQRELLQQCKRAFEEFSTRQGIDIAVLSGDVERKKRPAVHARRPDITIITKITCLNDFDLIDWDGVELVYRDEVQGDQGKDAGVALNKRLNQLNADRKKPFRIRGMSATLAANEGKLVGLRGDVDPQASRYVVKAETVETVECASSGESYITTTREHGLLVTEELLPVALDGQLRPLAAQLRLEALGLQERLKRAIEPPSLFPVPHERDFTRLPSYLERNALLEEVRSKVDEDDLFASLLSCWVEFNLYCNLFSKLTSMGRFAFLEQWFYLYAKKYLQSDLYLPEIDGRLKVEQRGKVRQADERAINNERLKPFVCQLAAGTPYEVMLDYDNWETIHREAYALLSPWERGVQRTYNYERRRLVIRSRNRQLRGSSSTATKYARDFFDDALSFMAHRELEDSPKLDKMTEKLNEHRETVQNGRSFGFTSNQRQADFMAELWEWRSEAAGFKAVSVHGGIGAGMDVFRRSGIKDFRNFERNLLWTTIHFAGTGFDIPGARVALYSGMPDSDPVKWKQSRGRVVGRAKKDPFVFVFATKNTLEPSRYWAAKKKDKARRKAVEARFEGLPLLYEQQ